MSEDVARGFAALDAAARKPSGRGGGGQQSPRGALNAAHHVLLRAGRPLSAFEIAVHAMGQGLWTSRSAKPTGVMAHPLDDEAKRKDDNRNLVGIIVKPEGTSGIYTLRKGCRDPLPTTAMVDAETKAAYEQLIIDGVLSPLEADDGDDTV